MDLPELPLNNNNMVNQDLQLLKEATDFMKYQIDLQNNLKTLIFYLGARTIMEKEDGALIIERIPNIKPKVNDEGFYALLNRVLSFVNHNTILTKYSERDARHILRHFLDDISILLFRNQRKWAMSSDGYLTPDIMEEVIGMIENLAYPTIFRAINGEDRDTIRKSGSYIEQKVNNGEHEKEKRFLGII